MASGNSDQGSSSKVRSLVIEQSLLDKAKRRLTKAAVGTRFYRIFDILMEIVQSELGAEESKEFQDNAIKMAVSVGYHVKVSDFNKDTVREMRRLTHNLSMTASHYQKMSMIYDANNLTGLLQSLRQLLHSEGAAVLDEVTHRRIDKIVDFFTLPILDEMFEDDGKYKDPSLRLMVLLDTLLEEGRI